MVDRLDPDQEALAAELALGLLEGEARADALRRNLADPAFAAAVDAWRVRLDPMYDEFASVPPAHLWPAIEARLAPGLARSDAAASRQIRRWRWLAAGSGALAASFAAAFLFARPEPVTIVREVVRAPTEVAVAQLGGKAGTLLAANYEPDDGALRVRAIIVPEGPLVPELWVIPAGGAPQSLGLLDGHGVTKVTVPARLRALLIDGATLAVTMEPVEGAPHTAPSSAPIATGTISRI